MTRTVRLAVAQPECVARDVAANARAHADLVRRAEGARVVVFPEMSLTGYELDAPPLSPGDPRLAPLVEACAETGALALAGAPVGTAAGKHIGVLAVDGTGARVAYRKMFVGGAEPEFMTPGDEPAAVTVDGVRLGLAVCKDTGVPEQAARTAALGIDAYLAGVLDHAHERHVHGERARRIAAEHGVWVAFASFAGGTGFGFTEAAGHSTIWAPDGRVVAEAGPLPGDLAIHPVECAG
ncbi:carbon-nitrogen hydrolase family protein [Catenuloplanes atrovinosus]|uniref:Amidohydrolase n=1 Tax=Catenuloplanes atrovinosus TaxID=137266 RepID=A0AAE3YIZ5_9ACTN|nr:carbon-nitrogen hydrolase family protein [Catenuloplanes atrovinosus]MDR7274355.1 putative amidohydrolase [Catenuloplanes atrovinosus]